MVVEDERPNVVQTTPSPELVSGSPCKKNSHQETIIWNHQTSKCPSPQLVEQTVINENGADNSNDTLQDKNSESVSNSEIAGDDLNDAKAHLSDASRRIHEMDIEIKRLENEREELSIAYREAETLRKQEEAKAQRLASELTSVRHDYERRLTIKEEELDSLRYT
ncbi:paramyosin [Caerostris extrusa]|uniref:Paramyosin n=1 Tax=Caerostris extrusa TaxID=172846 RepID=A0AAV4SA35_CAEEX|nr:paramyosin [Caerostris extrusa]